MTLGNRSSREVLITSARLQQALKALAAVPDTGGYQKLLTLSALADLQPNIAAIPTSVTYLCYDFEGTYTPLAEWNDGLNSALAFSTQAHAAGFKTAWAPTHAVFDAYVANGQITQIASAYDVLIYQGQNVLLGSGLNALTTLVQVASPPTRAGGARFYLQLWVDSNGSAATIGAFQSLAAPVDIIGVGTIKDSTDTNAVLTGLRRT